MNKDEKKKIALWYIQNYCYKRYTIDANATLDELELIIKNDRHLPSTCDNCIHTRDYNPFCTDCNQDRNKWAFQYTYWNKIMKRNND